MNITCTQEQLSFGLSMVSHIATKNVSLPILNNVLLQAKNNTLQLLTTNLEMTITASIPCVTEEQGETTTQAALFSSVVSLLPKNEVCIQTTDAMMYIKGEDQETKLHAIAASEYPVIPALTPEVKMVLNTAQFREALSQTLFSATINEVRPEISGILFFTHDQTLVMVGTDSYRLAERRLVLKELCDQRKFIVPLRALQELLRILGNSSGNEVEVIVSSNQVQFASGSVTLTSRLIEGNYPAYEQVIPDTYKTKVFVSTEELLQAVKRASLFCAGGVNDITLAFKPEANKSATVGGSIVVSVTNANLGENTTVLKASIEGQEQKIVFNYRYVTEGLQHINTDEARIDVISESSPGVFRPVDNTAQHGQYLYLIMPIKST